MCTWGQYLSKCAWLLSTTVLQQHYENYIRLHPLEPAIGWASGARPRLSNHSQRSLPLLMRVTDGTVPRLAVPAPRLSTNLEDYPQTQQWRDFTHSSILRTHSQRRFWGFLFPAKMATGAGWQPPYSTSTSSSKYSPSPAASMFYDGSLTLDYTQDLHLKMSKKIAQLTKVWGWMHEAGGSVQSMLGYKHCERGVLLLWDGNCKHADQELCAGVSDRQFGAGLFPGFCLIVPSCRSLGLTCIHA